MGYKEDLIKNLEVIAKAKELTDTKRLPTPEEFSLLGKLTSWGNFKELLYPVDVNWQRLTSRKSILEKEEIIKKFVEQLKLLFPDNFAEIYSSIKSSISTSFYTDPDIVKSIFERIDKESNINSFLDPCVGGGIFIDEFIRRYPDTPKSNIYALDIDPVSVLITKAKYPDINVLNMAFEKFKSPISFDLISSNIPFANNPVIDKEVLVSNATIRIHNYFLFKCTELLNNNGILQIITTGGLVNSKANSVVLAEVSKKLTPKHLIPLSSKAFKGTEVNSVYLEGIKDGNPTNARLDLINMTEDKILLNSFIDRSKFALEVDTNPYGKPEYSLKVPNSKTISYLNSLSKISFESVFRGIERIADFYLGDEIIGKIAKDIFNNKYQINTNSESNWLSGKEFKEKIHSFYIYLLDQSEVKKDIIRIESNNEPFKDYFKTNYYDKYSEKIGLILKQKPILINDTSFSEENLLQGELVKINNDFFNVSKNFLVKIDNPKLELLNDYYELKEYYKDFLKNNQEEFYISNLEESYKKFISRFNYSDIKEFDSFSLFINSLNNTSIFERPVDRILSAKESLYKVLNEKDSFLIEDLLKFSELSSSEILDELNDVIIFNPIINKYQQRDYFFSGNMYELIDKLRLLDGDHTALISEIEANLPERVHFPEIKVQFGTRWLDQKYFSEFVNKKYNAEFKTHYHPETDFFIVSPVTYSEIYSNETFKTLGNRYIKAEDVISNAFYHTYPIITYSETIDGKRITYTDTNSSELLKRKIDALREEFNSFMKGIPQEEKDKIEEYYNRTRNIKPYIPNGDHLNFDEIKLEALGIEVVKKHQKSAVWKNVLNCGGLVDHEVGLGKTLTMILEAYLLKKIGKARKPMIIGLPANYGDLKTAFELLVPTAKILFLDNDKNFSPQNRQETILRIANENWDVIIGSHPQFKMFKMPADKEIQYIESSLQNCRDNLFNIKNEFGSLDVTKKQIAGLEKKVKNLEIKLNEKLGSISRISDENILAFDQMGIDHLIVDESHIFKNLDLETRHERVAGLSAQGSDRSLHLLIGAEVIREIKGIDNFGISFYSGTPIANQLAECYTIKKYMIPGVLKSMGIHNFDSWASNFIIKACEYEVNTVGSIISKERFRYYINVPDLAGIYGSFTDIMTGEMANIDRPKANHKLVLTPELSSQRRFMKKLERFLITGDSSKLDLEKPLNMSKDSIAKSIVAMNLAFKASLDMRLINSKYKDDPESKINYLVRDIISHYENYNDIKSTQIAFIDISTPKQSFNAERVTELKDKNIFTNIYDDISAKLLKHGIKAEEIAYIHDYSTPTKKEKLSKKMNNGEIRILLASTEKGGVGLNVQKRLMKIHNVTIPWRPADMSQRTGRIERQGNDYCKLYNNNIADVLTYATEKTFDNLKINTVANKSKFINQLKEATIHRNMPREIDEGGIDENTGMNLAEFQAQISGDNTLLEFTKVNMQVEELRKKKNDIETGQMLVNSKILRLEKEIISREKAIVIIERTLKFDTEENNELPKYFDVKDYNEKNIKEYYEQLENFAIVGVVSPIAEYKGFTLFHCIRNSDENRNEKYNEYHIESKTENYSFMIASGERNGASINHFQNIINSLQRRLLKNKEVLNEEAKKLEELKAIPIIEWSVEQDEDLQNLILDKNYLERKLAERAEHLKELEPVFEDGYKLIDSLAKFQYCIENEVFGIEGQWEKFNVSSDVLKAMQMLEDQNIGFMCSPFGISDNGIYTSTDILVKDYMTLNNEINFDIIFPKGNDQEENYYKEIGMN